MLDPECKRGVGISYVTLGENIPLHGVHLKEGILSLQGQNPIGILKQPFIRRGQRHAQRVGNLVTAFHCAIP